MSLKFRCEPQMVHLPVSYRRIIALQKSRSEVEVALEGRPSETASLLVCLYSPQKDELGLVVAFHLKPSDQLVFYRYAGDLTVPRNQLLDAAALFAESLGFLLDDLSYSARDDAARQKLWQNLPLEHGTQQQTLQRAAVATRSAAAQTAARLSARKARFLRNLGRLLGSL